MDNEERSTIEKTVAPVPLSDQEKLEKLKGSWQLLKEACVEYRARFATSLAIFSVPITLSILLSGLSYATMFPPFAYMPLLSGVKVVLSFLSLFAGILVGFALLLSIRDGYGARESLLQAIRNSIPYLFVSFLVFSSFIGGLFLFFVPGLLFLAWFSFSFFAFVFEGKRGMDALLRNKQLFSGNFWKVVGRMSFLAIILLILTIPLAIFGQYVGHWGNLMLEVFTLLLVPVMLLYSLSLFRDLVRVQENATPAVSKVSFRVFVWLCVLLGTPFIVGMIAFRSMLLVTHDIPEPDDSDLQLPILNIPREENAYYVFSEAKDMELGSSEVSTFLDGSEWDDERVRDILQKNQNVLDVFERGVLLPVFQQPEFQNPDRYDVNLESEPIGYLRSLANVSLLKAHYFFRNGMQSDAFRQVMKTIKMGQMIEDAQGSTISYLFGMAIKNKGLDSIRVFLDSTNSSSEELLRYSRDLSGFRESKRALVKALKAEYIFDTQSLDREIVPVLRGERSVSINMNGSPEVRFGLSGEHFSLMKKRGSAIFYYFQPNEVKRLSARFFRTQLEGADEDFLALDDSLLEKQKMRGEFVLDSTWMAVFRRNSFGRVLVSIQVVSEGNLNVRRFQEKFSVQATQVLLALKAFEQDRGVLPNSLQELVPAYLSEVPRDPFDGKLMRYDAERRMLYSTGENLIDDGGDIDEKNWRGGKDLGFWVQY